MKVYYRIYPGNADNKPFADGDKGTLMGVCLTSFLESCQQANVHTDLTILLDGCPSHWEDVVRSIAGQERVVVTELGGIGNRPSFLEQLEMVLTVQDDELVYFAEDDYLYRPEAISKLLYVYAMEKADSFFTLYDHPDRYFRDDDRDMVQRIKLAGAWHWRTVESTTMTFGASGGLIKATADIIRDHACEGRQMWYPLLDEGYDLWGPVPSLATHVHEGMLAPCVDWDEIWHSKL